MCCLATAEKVTECVWSTVTHYCDMQKLSSLADRACLGPHPITNTPQPRSVGAVGLVQPGCRAASGPGTPHPTQERRCPGGASSASLMCNSDIKPHTTSADRVPGVSPVRKCSCFTACSPVFCKQPQAMDTISQMNQERRRKAGAQPLSREGTHTLGHSPRRPLHGLASGNLCVRDRGYHDYMAPCPLPPPGPQ